VNSYTNKDNRNNIKERRVKLMTGKLALKKSAEVLFTADKEAHIYS
jgi:hypothetical protein